VGGENKALRVRVGRETALIPCRPSGDGVTIEVRVHPRSSRLMVDCVEGGVLKVKLTAPPARGEANEQLLKLLSKEFGVSKSSVRIIKGHASKDKVVEISGLTGSS
jgi:uncharacterized protein (TIGR00251 family)